MSKLSSVPLPTPEGPETMMGWRLAGRFSWAVVVAGTDGHPVVEEAIASSENEGTSRVRARRIDQELDSYAMPGQPSTSRGALSWLEEGKKKLGTKIHESGT
jgi:hypothetical protein